MIVSKLILAAFMSASFRSANIQPNPSDFEFKGGIEAVSNNTISAFTERENGSRYKGFEWKRSDKYTFLDIYYKEARDIDRQSFGVKYPIKDFSLGVTLNSIRWEDPAALLLMQYQTKILTMSYEVGEDRQYLSSRLSQKLAVNNRVYIEPMLTYYKQYVNSNDTEFWQAKLLIGYKLLKPESK